MVESDFEYTEKENFGTLRLFGEKRYNIISESCVKKLDKLLTDIGKKENPGAIILRGNENSFATGLDIDIFKQLNNKEIGIFAHACCRMIDRFENSDKIFISAVNGYCLGGGLEVAMATDYIIASKDAKFGLPEIKLGLLPGADGIKRLVRCVGKRRAMDLIMTGRTITAKEALAMGLINEVVSRRKLISRAEELARDISSKNPVAIKEIKRLVNKAAERNITNDEIKAFQRCLATPNAKNAIESFLNKTAKR